jgi:hypothetical protein
MSELYYLKQNAISPEEITTLIAYIKNNLTKDYRDHYQHAGILMHDFYESPDLEFQALRKVIEICRKTFIENYSFNYDKFELKRLFGNVMGQGAINEAHDDDGDRYPNKPVIEEHYSAVLMLSSDYTGGELFFQHHNKEIRLEPGDLIMFRGNAENLHGVREVLSGERINVIIFFRNCPTDVAISNELWLEVLAGKN